MKNHLIASSYRSLSLEEAEAQMGVIEPEFWEEEKQAAKQWEEWSQPDREWSAKRRRRESKQAVPSARACAAVPAPNAALVRQAFGAPTISLGLRGSASSNERVLVGIPVDAPVAVNGVQAQIIIDSLSRARAATLAMQQVAQSALTAFNAEAERLADLQEVLVSWLREVQQ